MNDEVKKKSLGSSVLDPIIEGYRVGGMVLALILVGTLLLLTAVASGPGIISYVCAFVGAIVILSILFRIYFVDLKKIKEFKDSVKENEELLNSIQDSAIQLTELSSHLQSLAFKHADKVGPAITQIRNTVKLVADLPMVGNTEIGRKVAGLADHEKIKGAEQLSHDIVEYTEAAKEVVENIRIALTELNPKPIKQYSEQIGQLDERIKQILKKSA